MIAVYVFNPFHRFKIFNNFRTTETILSPNLHEGNIDFHVIYGIKHTLYVNRTNNYKMNIHIYTVC